MRVDRPLASVDAGKGARFLRALLYAHMIAMQRTHPRPIAVAPKITAVESGAPEAPTASPTSAKAVGGPGDGARGDASSGEGAPSGRKTAQARSVRGASWCRPPRDDARLGQERSRLGGIGRRSRAWMRATRSPPRYLPHASPAPLL